MEGEGGGEGGVHVSSIGNWGWQDNFKSIFFFFIYEKISHTQNTHNRTLANKTKTSKQKTTKTTIFCAHELTGWQSFVLRLVLFCSYEIFFFLNKQLETVSLAWITYTTILGKYIVEKIKVWKLITESNSLSNHRSKYKVY